MMTSRTFFVLYKERLEMLKKTLAKIHDLRAKEAEELSRWNEEVEGVENKVNFIVNNIVGIKE